jgi:Lipopolysaccharide kinase (Kdo/WaaP) family
MFWIHPAHRTTFATASVDSYDAMTRLRPADHFVEKQGRSTGRYVIDACGRQLSFFLKKYHQLSWWQRWFAPLSRYPGPRELANIKRAAALGVPVPKPLVAGASREHNCRSILAVRELEGYLPLHEFIPRRFGGSQSTSVRQLRRELTCQLADISRRLHCANHYHCDLYLCHFFIRESTASASCVRLAAAGHEGADARESIVQPGSFDLVLIDFTRLKRSWNPRWQVKDLAQLLFSSDLPGISRTDRMRFFKRYLACVRLDGPARRLLRRVQWKASLYHRHNETLARRAAA